MTEETLFATALEQADPAAYLDAHCPDPAARRRVEELLVAHAAAGSFLNHPAVGAEVTTALPPADPATRTQASTDPDATADPRTGPADPDDTLAFLKPPTRPGSLGRLAHYEVLEVLGSGGFGTVLKAFDDRLHRVVAVKVLAPQLAASGAARQRFERESKSAAAVRDDHVVNVHAVSEPGDPLPFLVMEFVAGQTLQAKADNVGPLPSKEVLRIGSQIARGLAAAHKQGLIHRDIKPANILLENGVERVKVTDFGLARAADDASISQSGVVAGTPMFMSPEQARGDTLDTRSDLFSLGSVLYVLCTGRPPFRADTTLGVLKRVVEDDPRPVRDVNPEVPRWLADVVAKLHAKNPADRFQTAAEVAELLSGYLAELQQQGTVVSRVAPPPRPTARTGWGWWFAAALTVAAVLTAGGVLGESDPPVPRREVHYDLATVFAVFGLAVLAPAAALMTFSRRWGARGLGAAGAGLLAATANVALGLLSPAGVNAPPPQAVLTLRLGNTAMQYRVDETGPHQTGVAVIEVPLEPGEHWLWFQLGDRAYRTSKFRLEPGARNELVVEAAGGFATATLDGQQIGVSGGPGLPPTRLLQAPFDHGTARDGQEAWAKQLGVPVEFTNAAGITFRLIPPGEYGMGFTAADLAAVRAELKGLPNVGDYERFAAESSAPRHTVRITRPFYLAKYETTADQYRRFVEATGHTPTGTLDWKGYVTPGPEDRQPVLGVSWADAATFCGWLGAGYELPTEAQWEYAARAGNPGAWAFGDAPAELVDHAVVGQPVPKPGLVGLKKANGFGLFDVHGNADEWCRDWHVADYYRRAPVDDPVNVETPSQPNTGRASRGGSWNAAAVFSRVAFRTFDHPTRPARPKGFRVALTGDLKAAVDAAARGPAAPWGEFVNPLGDCRMTEDAGGLAITVPPGNHDLSPRPNSNLNAPRVLRDVTGDFETRVTVQPLPKPRAGTSSRPNGASYVGAGLVVWQDDRIAFRLFRAGVTTNKDGEPYAQAEWFPPGKADRGHAAKYVPDGPLHLRLRRAGGVLHPAYSTDGRSWTELGAVTDLPLAARVRVGVAAVSTMNQPVTARFEGLAVEPAAAKSPAPPAATHALSFDGVDDYVEVPTLKYDGTHPITLEAWVRVPQAPDRVMHVVSNDGAVALGLNERGQWSAGVRDQSGNTAKSFRYIWSAEPAEPGKLTHVAMVLFGTEGRLFVDGKRQTTKAAQRGDHVPSEAPFFLGARRVPRGVWDYPLRGEIAAVRVSKVARYDRDFTPPAGRFDADKLTTALYHFDAGQGDVLADSSGNNHHGKIVGAKWVPVAAQAPADAVGQARRARVAAMEKELAAAKARFDAGFNTRREVAEAEIGVFEAQLDGAPALDAVRLFVLIIERHEVRRAVAAARVEAGVLTPDALHPIDADLARAKARLAEVRVPVPQRAADVLPFWVGTWRSTSEIVVPAPAAGKGHGGGDVVLTLVGDGKYLRGVGTEDARPFQTLLVQTYDESKGALRGWVYKSDGKVSGPGPGLWTADARTLLWTEKLPDGIQSVHRFEFVDADTVRARLLHQNEKNEIVFDLRNTYTRRKAPASERTLPAPADRPAELAALDRLVGEWRNETTWKVLVPPAQERKVVTIERGRPILGSRFVEVTHTGGVSGTNDYWLAGYDPAAKRYRTWFFGADGNTAEFAGTWDAAAATMRMASADGSAAGSWVFPGADRRDGQFTIKDAAGQPVAELTSTSRRVGLGRKD